jgi:hypothetical protein
MNKLLQEFAIQSGLPTALDYHQKRYEKYAELIVQECADIAKHHVMNISTYADADFVDEQIKQHFGVEE